MKIIKLIFLITIIKLNCYSSETLNDLYLKAEKFEKNKDFKEAMNIYKKIANHNLNKNLTKIKEKNLENSLVGKTPHLDTSKKNDNNSLKKILISDFVLYSYKTNYILPATYDFNNKNDRKNFETNFQISFLKPILYNFFNLNEEISFAYTQKSYWQTSANSMPFRENNYIPELFINIPFEGKFLKNYKFSIIHQSNGEDGDKSVSWNRLYLQGFYKINNLFISPKIWYVFNEDSSNNDTKITDFLGYGDLSISYKYGENVFKSTFKNNLKFKKNKASLLFEWTFPFPNSITNYDNIYGIVYGYTGYGESLFDYNKRNDKIGIGIALTR